MQLRVSSGQLKVETTRGIEGRQCGCVMWEKAEGHSVPIENTLHAQRVLASGANRIC